MHKSFLVLMMVAAGLISARANATLQVSADINGTPFACADGQACDTNPLPGRLGIANQTLGGVQIVGSSQFQTIGPTNFLNTSSFQLVNTNLTPATITFTVSGVDFLGPITGFNDSGSGTWQNADGSNITLTFFIDPANQQGADSPLDRPGTLVDTFTDTAVGPADAFSHSGLGPFTTGLLHSLTLGAEGTLAAWDGLAGDQPTLVGNSETIITHQAVPEPGSLALLGIGCLVMAGIRRKLRGEPQLPTPLPLSH